MTHRRMIMILAVAAGVLVIGAFFLSFRYLNGHSDRCLADANTLAAACQAYFKNPKSGGSYPSQLSDLLQPPFGGSAYLNSPDAIIDPWGQPFKYAVLSNENGGHDVYVWAERTAGGKTAMIGVKLSADGRAIHFGEP